jgi:hypothetical protein
VFLRSLTVDVDVDVGTIADVLEFRPSAPDEEHVDDLEKIRCAAAHLDPVRDPDATVRLARMIFELVPSSISEWTEVVVDTMLRVSELNLPSPTRKLSKEQASYSSTVSARSGRTSSPASMCWWIPVSEPSGATVRRPDQPEPISPRSRRPDLDHWLERGPKLLGAPSCITATSTGLVWQSLADHCARRQPWPMFASDNGKADNRLDPGHAVVVTGTEGF